MSKILLKNRDRSTNTRHITARELIDEAERNSTGTPDFFEVLGTVPGVIAHVLDLFLNEFDYANNKKSKCALALRILASTVSALDSSSKNALVALNDVKLLPSKKRR
jgi:hypothetical protein